MNAFLFHRPEHLPRTLLPVAATGLFLGAWIHLDLYRHGYRSIPTIGPLFAFTTAALAVAGLVVLFRRELIVRIAAIGVALATLAGFTASRLANGIFGFQEKGLNPSPQGAEALIGEIVAVVVLFGSFAWDRDLLRRTKSADVGNATSNVDRAGTRR